MIEIIRGCNISLSFEANELSSTSYTYTLPKGYSINIMHVTYISNIEGMNNAALHTETRLVFPAINSKSPCSISLSIPDITKSAQIRFTIEKFGQIPDPHYFENVITPILVKGEDGNEYNVIHSDQFK